MLVQREVLESFLAMLAICISAPDHARGRLPPRSRSSICRRSVGGISPPPAAGSRHRSLTSTSWPGVDGQQLDRELWFVARCPRRRPPKPTRRPQPRLPPKLLLAVMLRPSTDRTAADGIISMDDFAKVDLRIAKIVNTEHVEGSDKLLRLTLDVRRKPTKAAAQNPVTCSRASSAYARKA